MSGNLHDRKQSRSIGAMMRKLDQRGTAAFEFCVIAVVFFTTIFTIFDLARYVLTVQSLRTLAGAGARAVMINDCYMDAAIYKKTPNCNSVPLSTAAMQAAAPFLYSNGSSAPQVSLSGTGPY